MHAMHEVKLTILEDKEIPGVPDFKAFGRAVVTIFIESYGASREDVKRNLALQVNQLVNPEDGDMGELRERYESMIESALA